MLRYFFLLLPLTMAGAYPTGPVAPMDGHSRHHAGTTLEEVAVPPNLSAGAEVYGSSAGSATLRRGAFTWPDGRRAALSLSFDDARPSQVTVGLPIFDRHEVKATFFVVPSAVEEHVDGWRRAREAGHEIGNHSLVHPCSGNFLWSRDRALEDYTLDRMRAELLEANERIHDLLAVEADVFAYPCGQTYVGRGVETQSYVPVVAEHFLVGRGWLDEAPNDPDFVDFAQVMAIEMDGRTFSEILPVIEAAKERGLWVVLAGHEIGEEGFQTTRVAMLEELLAYVEDPTNEVWAAPVGRVAKYIQSRRSE